MTSPATAVARDQFAERVMNSVAGALALFTGYIGDRLGLYLALAQNGPMTSEQLAQRTGTHERYIREWLEQQTVAGFISVDNPGASALERQYRLPAGHDEVLTDAESLNYLAPVFQLIAGVAKPLPEILEAFRTGKGVPYTSYGEMHEGQGRMNRTIFLQQLPEWLASIPELHTRLQASERPRIADIGCGHGWSGIGMARAYPNAEIHGFDLDEASIGCAMLNVQREGLSDRVRFWIRDAADAEFAGRYDLVIALECLHDMSNPVGALRTMRRLANESGEVIIVDERVGHTFTPGGVDLEWLMYGCSVLHCLPVGMCEQPSAGTGTVMRVGTVREYAKAAGFRDIDVLPIDHMLFRVYRLVN
jgi:2-polyprenyl-3-methyl-5-hydroxy-6-metoxy-1,4-benzoquinol methylase